MPTEQNPANAPGPSEGSASRKRIPMSVPRRKLETTVIPGFRCYWFLEERIPQAIQAGYEFVDDREVHVNQSGVASDLSVSGNQSLDSRVRIHAGGGQYFILMKIKEEWFREDQQLIAKRNAEVLSQIFRGEVIVEGEGAPQQSQSDRNLRYVDLDRTSLAMPQKSLFQRPTRKSRT